MRIFLAEYAEGGDPALVHEGAAMIGVLKGSFERCGHDVIVSGPGDFGEQISMLAPTCDAGLVLAPDHLLSKYTALLERGTNNLGCGVAASALCTDKLTSGKILRANGIPVPKELDAGRRVIKPVNGCGARDVRISTGNPGKDEFAQEYIEGENYSVSIISYRVDDKSHSTIVPPFVLSVNRQNIEIGVGGSFAYLGGSTPVHPLREDEIASVAQKTATILGCQGYCGVDVVVADQVYVVDVNPRITTSIVGITACMEEEIADLLVAASNGERLKAVHFNGNVSYDTRGHVIRN